MAAGEGRRLAQLATPLGTATTAMRGIEPLPPRAAAAWLFVSPGRAQSLDDLNRLSLQDLTTVEVTSVSRRRDSLANAPAAVDVIPREDIRRSGAVSLPEALRRAPNLLDSQHPETGNPSMRREERRSVDAGLRWKF